MGVWDGETFEIGVFKLNGCFRQRDVSDRDVWDREMFEIEWSKGIDSLRELKILKKTNIQR